MDLTGKTRLVGVIGWPVEHSLSPPMHNAALARLGLDWAYVAMPVRPENLAAAVAGARALGFVGLNVTLPHKPAMAALVDKLEGAARAIGAVNTVHFAPEGTIGWNSDAYGFARSVELELDFDFRGKTVLQIGAGGVGRAMAVGAAEAGAARAILFNRTLDRAEALARDLAPFYPATRFEPATGESRLPALAAEADLIANATTLGMKPGDALPLPVEAIQARHVVFDTIYIPSETPLIQTAKQRGAKAAGGLGMLARQGEMSLTIWTRGVTDQKPDELLMLETLKSRLA